jgi:hypothetical protein
MMRKLRPRHIILLFALVVLAACARNDILDDINGRISDLREITAFRFLTSQNPGLTRNCYGTIDNATFSIIVAVPAGTVVTSLVPDFEIRGDHVTTSDLTTTIVSGDPASVLDYSTNPTTLVVHAENGNNQPYQIIVVEDLTAVLTYTGAVPLFDKPGTIDVSFNRNINEASVSASDFLVVNGTVTVQSTAPASCTLNVFPVADGNCSVVLASGQVLCTYGTENLQSAPAVFAYNAPPVPGTGGQIRVTAVGYDSVSLEWDPATDDTLAVLDYLVAAVPTGPADIDTPAEVVALGGTWQTGTTTTINGLSEGTTYWVTVLVRDQYYPTPGSQHAVLYQTISVTTKVEFSMEFEFELPGDEYWDLWGTTTFQAGETIWIGIPQTYSDYRWYVDGQYIPAFDGTSQNNITFSAANFAAWGSPYPVVGPHTITCIVTRSDGVVFSKTLLLQVGAN